VPELEINTPMTHTQTDPTPSTATDPSFITVTGWISDPGFVVCTVSNGTFSSTAATGSRVNNDWTVKIPITNFLTANDYTVVAVGTGFNGGGSASDTVNEVQIPPRVPSDLTVPWLLFPAADKLPPFVPAGVPNDAVEGVVVLHTFRAGGKRKREQVKYYLKSSGNWPPAHIPKGSGANTRYVSQIMYIKANHDVIRCDSQKQV
jgi:hypothetical protein